MGVETFFAADLHMGHKLMERVRPFETLEEHDRQIVERWNSVVRDKDVVWVLGDVVINRRCLPLLDLLRGRKKLVMGNHDVHHSALYLDHFEKIYGAIEFKGCILTHIPVHRSQGDRFRANVHGHLHSKTLEDPFYVNVSLEQIDYAPISWPELQKRLPPTP